MAVVCDEDLDALKLMIQKNEVDFGLNRILPSPQFLANDERRKQMGDIGDMGVVVGNMALVVTLLNTVPAT